MAQSPSQSCAHLAGEHRVFAVTLLCSPPGGMAQEIYADRSRVVGTARTSLTPHGEPDALLKRGVPRRSPHDCHRERGRPSDHDAARAVAEPDAWYTEARYGTAGERAGLDPGRQPQH